MSPNQIPQPAQPNPSAQPNSSPTPPGTVAVPSQLPATAGGALPTSQTNPNSTQNTLHIAEIRDGIVIMSDGSYRSVIMAQSINFDLMSGPERESVEYAYQGFINSLYFPVQIYIRSQRIDMRPYLQKLEDLRLNQENMLLGLLMEDYILFISELVDQTNIMDKKFYIVVPYFQTLDIAKPVEAGKKVFGGFVDLFKINKSPTETIVVDETDLEKAKQELRNRVQSVVNGLGQMGVQGVPLDTQELIELYYDSYNPDTATRQSLGSMSDLNTPLVTKGKGQASAPPLNGGIY